MELGADLARTKTLRSLKDALRFCAGPTLAAKA
jgi:hypothetical protein